MSARWYKQKMMRQRRITTVTHRDKDPHILLLVVRAVQVREVHAGEGGEVGDVGLRAEAVGLSGVCADVSPTSSGVLGGCV